MDTIPKSAFRYPVQIRPEHIDEMNHVNNIVYLHWVQEVSTAHWKSLMNSTIQDAGLWVVGRHEVDYLRPCLMNDTIEAFTWLEEPAGKSWCRIVVFMNSNTGKLMTRVKTTWILVDAVTQRSKMIPQELHQWYQDMRSSQDNS